MSAPNPLVGQCTVVHAYTIVHQQGPWLALRLSADCKVLLCRRHRGSARPAANSRPPPLASANERARCTTVTRPFRSCCADIVKRGCRWRCCLHCWACRTAPCPLPPPRAGRLRGGLSDPPGAGVWWERRRCAAGPNCFSWPRSGPPLSGCGVQTSTAWVTQPHPLPCLTLTAPAFTSPPLRVVRYRDREGVEA